MTINTTLNLTAQQSILLLNTLLEKFHSLANTYEHMVDNNVDKQLVSNAFDAKKEVLQIIWKLEGEK
jgi:uracil DNA glycosylase